MLPFANTIKILNNVLLPVSNITAMIILLFMMPSGTIKQARVGFYG